jgi:hypothetical protein
MMTSQDQGLTQTEPPENATYAAFLNRRRVTPEQPTDDVLSVETIARIEELHSTVLWAEKERRFGILRPRRGEELRAAVSAEQDFLNEHGFASYNEFRLRIRRSKAVAPGAPPAVIEAAPAVLEPVPAVGEAAPAVVAADPADVEAAPAVVAADPADVEAAPAVPEPAPAVIEVVPVVGDAAPVVGETVADREPREDQPSPPPPAELPAPLEPRVPLGRWTEDWAMDLRKEFDRRLSERVAKAELQLEGASLRSDHGG